VFNLLTAYKRRVFASHWNTLRTWMDIFCFQSFQPPPAGRAALSLLVTCYTSSATYIYKTNINTHAHTLFTSVLILTQVNGVARCSLHNAKAALRIHIDSCSTTVETTQYFKLSARIDVLTYSLQNLVIFFHSSCRCTDTVWMDDARTRLAPAGPVVKYYFCLGA
jgi:hypothetical protein